MLELSKKKEFKKAYTEFYPIVFSTLLAKTNKREDAEDICQEVFIRFYHNFDDIRDKRRWLFTALKFEITNYYNKKSTAKSDNLDIDDMEEFIKSDHDDDYIETRIVIEEVINDMSNYSNEKEKNLFDLIAIHNFTFREAAKNLGMTKWQAEYKYKQIEKRILANLKDKGIRKVEDLI